MRLFIAVDLKKRSKRLLRSKFEIIKKGIDEDLKWVEQYKWHITIKFLGEVNNKKVKDIKELIKASSQNINSFYLQLSGLKAFPNANYPKVLYINIKRGKKELTEIHDNFDKQLEKFGFDRDERGFNPHLTLARVKRNSDKNIIADSFGKLNDDIFINIFSRVDKISLIKSELTVSGPIYTEIFTNNLLF